MAGKYVLADGANLYAKNGSTEFQLVTSTGQLYHQGTAIAATAAELNNLSGQYTVAAGSTAANLANNGISTLSWSTAGDPAYTLAAPAAGVEKTIVLNTTAVQDTTGIFSSVYSGSTATFFIDNSTAYAPKLYVGFQPPYSAVKLVGLSTAQWGVLAAYGGTKFSTQAVFST